ncbi:hypothetical protein Peur_055046 [Populus x canadensis]
MAPSTRSGLAVMEPRVIIMLVKAGALVDQTIKTLSVHMEKGDCIIDGGLLYLGMGVSGGEEGAWHGPSLMPGGSFEASKHTEDILLKVVAQVPDSGPCVTYIGKGGAGNFVKMVHKGIEYGDMQMISEAYDVLKSVGKLTNEELHQVLSEWFKGELLSFLIEITADVFGIRMTREKDICGVGDILVDQVVDTVKLIHNVIQAINASKICSYAQGMNLIRARSSIKGWDLKQGEQARIWKGGCIIHDIFLDRIKKAYDRNPDLPNLLVDPGFAKEIIERQSAWRRVVSIAINSGISTTPGMSSSLAYFHAYRSPCCLLIWSKLKEIFMERVYI